MIPHTIQVYDDARAYYNLTGRAGTSFSDFVLNKIGRTGNLVLTPDEDVGRMMYADEGWPWKGPEIDCNFVVEDLVIHRVRRVTNYTRDQPMCDNLYLYC